MLDAAVLQRQLFASQFDDGLEDSFPEDLPVALSPAPVWDRAGILEADLEEVLELSVAGRSSVLEFLQGDVGGDQTGVSIALIVAFIVLVIYPRAFSAVSKDEPVFNMVAGRYPVQLDPFVACHIVPVLPAAGLQTS